MNHPGDQPKGTVEIDFDNSYVRELPGFYSACSPVKSPQPELVYFNPGLAEELGLGLGGVSLQTLADFFSGNQLHKSAEPIAQVYAGHQFGYFNPQLGDGRALILGEVVTPGGDRFDINLKGSGKTPYSRGGDGKAALGPMLREVVIGEAMHALGIPSTRALATTTTGLPVYREEILQGTILTRVASSHIRVGTFEYFAARGEQEKVKRLADYTIARHDPHLVNENQPYLGLLKAVGDRLARLIAQWMSVGFIHGVMNTDNMSIAGETIDYGPCAFMDTYDPRTVFSAIDSQGRYAFHNQPRIAQWNLARFAETLLSLLADDEQEAIEQASEVVTDFVRVYQNNWLDLHLKKMGLVAIEKAEAVDDEGLVNDWLTLLAKQKVDFTLAWRYLAHAAEGNYEKLESLFAGDNELQIWVKRWQNRYELERQPSEQSAARRLNKQRAVKMKQYNPWLIPRNHLVEAALKAASDNGDLKPFGRLMEALSQPYLENEGFSEFAKPASPAFYRNYATFCGT